jgi:Ca-activated chloride channel family protein
MIEFAYPWFFGFLVLPMFVRWLATAYKEKKHSIQVPYFQRLVNVSGETPQSGAVILNRKTLQSLLIIFAWLCIVTAMAKPEIIGPPIVQEKSARDLMIAVDLSGSMEMKDFKTVDNELVDRLTAVKYVLTEFVKGREQDRLGLILFGDAPYLQAPFTDDLDTWLTLFNEAEIGMAGQSTAFGDAIGLSIGVFDSEKTENRVLIVLTDGNDTASKVPPVEAAKVAAAYDIKIYTIAIGDPETLGEEKVDLVVLKNVAEITGGKSFQALNREDLAAVYLEIDTLEPQLFESQSFRPRVSAHYYPVVLLVLVYCVVLLIVNLRYWITSRMQQSD